MNDQCRTYEGVTSRILHRFVLPFAETSMNESCCTHEWVVSHVWMSHVTHMNESCCAYEWHHESAPYEWVTQTHLNESHVHIWMSHEWMTQRVTHNESLIVSYTYEWVTNEWHHEYERVANEWNNEYEWHNELLQKKPVLFLTLCVIHIWMSHVTYIWTIYFTHTPRVRSAFCRHDITHINESCHTYEWVMSHM